MAFGRYVLGTLGNEANIIVQYYLVPPPVTINHQLEISYIFFSLGAFIHALLSRAYLSVS